GTTNPEPHPVATPAIAGLSPTLMTVYVVNGMNPFSSGVTVSAGLSGIGGSVNQQFYDDGTHGDLVANDHIFSYSFTPSAAIPATTYPIQYTVTDLQGRTVHSTFPLKVQGVTNVGSLPVNTTVQQWINLAQGEVRWYRFTVPTVEVSTAWLDIWSQGPV